MNGKNMEKELLAALATEHAMRVSPDDIEVMVLFSTSPGSQRLASLGRLIKNAALHSDSPLVLWTAGATDTPKVDPDWRSKIIEPDRCLWSQLQFLEAMFGSEAIFSGCPFARYESLREKSEEFIAN